MLRMLDVGLGTRLVLCYHGVSPAWPADPTVRPDRLREQVELLQKRGWRGLTLSDALRAPQRQKVFVVTFDDAHLSVYDLARPVLTGLGVPATIFVPTDYPDTGRLMGWPGYDVWLGTEHEQELACMSWEQLREVADADGWEIGSHTCSHPKLTTLDDAELARELSVSKAICEERMERPCPTFAYPYNNWDARTAVAAGEAGYSAAVTVDFGPWDLPLELPRVAVGNTDTAHRMLLRAWRRRHPQVDALLWRMRGHTPPGRGQTTPN
jgi:peptidoglycan/xylan/chitin deacetylase (PgdA/CDA1 family)